MFPGFSTVSGFKKASVGADENCTSGSFKNGAYSWLLKIFEYRRPYTRSVCFFQIYTPVIVGNIPDLPGAMLLCSSGKISLVQKGAVAFGVL